MLELKGLRFTCALQSAFLFRQVCTTLEIIPNSIPSDFY